MTTMWLRKFLHANFGTMVLQKRAFSPTHRMCQGAQNYSPNGLDKRFLVWCGKYKSVGEVPNFVSPETMERCRNRMRIRIANIMMLLTVVGCGIMVYSGKEAAKRGESVAKENLDWHKMYNEQNRNNTTK